MNERVSPICVAEEIKGIAIRRNFITYSVTFIIHSNPVGTFCCLSLFFLFSHSCDHFILIVFVCSPLCSNLMIDSWGYWGVFCVSRSTCSTFCEQLSIVLTLSWNCGAALVGPRFWLCREYCANSKNNIILLHSASFSLHTSIKCRQ